MPTITHGPAEAPEFTIEIPEGCTPRVAVIAKSTVLIQATPTKLHWSEEAPFGRHVIRFTGVTGIDLSNDGQTVNYMSNLIFGGEWTAELQGGTVVVRLEDWQTTKNTFVLEIRPNAA